MYKNPPLITDHRLLTTTSLLTHVPDSYDALVLAQLSQTHNKIVYIARDEARAARLRDQLPFFGVKPPVYGFPGWDCMPYDRTSPHPDILAQRLDTLSFLAENPDRYVVVTSLAAFLQKLPPRAALQGRQWLLKAGTDVDHTALLAFLRDNGYVRRETVREWGEFAVRGGLVDLFPPGSPSPVRLDFFGATLESLRTFDALSQLTTGTQESLTLKPMGEIHLTPETIGNFRAGYQTAFGASGVTDPLYQAIVAGQPHPGYEHWLPLFYPHLETLEDYTGGTVYGMDDQLEAAREAHLAQIRDHYETRLQFDALETKGVPYHPLPPERLYLLEETWEPTSDRFTLTPFSRPFSQGTVVDKEGKSLPSFSGFEALHGMVEDALKAKKQILVVGMTQGSADRLSHILSEHAFPPLMPVATFQEVTQKPALAVLEMAAGFQTPTLLVVTEEDILGERIGRSVKTKKRNDLFIQEISSLQPGDLVVHAEHGVGRYEGLHTLVIDRNAHDCLELTYDGGAKLYLPVENLEVLSRYGAADAQASLDKLGGVAWQARKAKVKKRLKETADYLLKIAAARTLHHAEILEKPEGLYDEFEARFPYPETDDQLNAIEDVLQDLASGQPMDRLICGDVGFGKTEVAMRAAFVTVSSGKQVAVIVPTTLLARQHYQSFLTRFKDMGIKIAQLSRLVKPKEASLVKEALAKGEIQIVIGTHALLSKGVEFHDLGLLIVDEEQHFGVGQKERLKNLREDVHVLTLTATPIPRTLQMALSGVREMSLITTPPLDRMAVRTFVLPFDGMVIREAILREQFRGGQTFYVCPRLSDLDTVAKRLQQFVPEVSYGVAHGQLSPTELENVMSAFYDGAFDVLLSTNIIESGIDIPRANTLLIHRADMFGLSQLYQLRGRVGRSKARGYAYLTYGASHPLSGDAQKRLEVIQSLDTLGAGFTLASHDMDIRGAGNLVGEEQSGHIREVGIELYQHMLEEAIASLKSDQGGERSEVTTFVPQIKMGLSVLIPEAYVADLGLRLSLYKRASDLTTREEIDQFAVELIDRFGPLPEEVKNLLEVIYLKSLCRLAHIDKVEVGTKGVLISFYKDSPLHPDRLIHHITEQKGTAKIRPDQKIVYARAFATPALSLEGTRQILEELVAL